MDPTGLRPRREESVFRRMVRDHQAGLWRYLRLLGCDPAQAEDLVQEVFLKVWRRPFEYRSPTAAFAYLRRAARSAFLDAVRREKVRLVFSDLREVDRVFESVAGEDGGDAYLDALRTCLGFLRSRVRRVLSLFYAERRSRQEIAEREGLSPDGVKTLLRRARERLRDCVERRAGS